MMTDFHVNRITQSEEQRKHLHQYVEEMRLLQQNLEKHKDDERCTKAITKKVKYDYSNIIQYSEKPETYVIISELLFLVYYISSFDYMYLIENQNLIRT